MKTCKDLVKQLRESKKIDLNDFQALSYSDLETLSETIKVWHIYGNGDPVKLGKITESEEK